MDKFVIYMQQHWAWVFGVMSVVIATLGLTLTFVIFKRSWKSFSYRIITDVPFVVGSAMDVHKKTNLTLNGKPVADVRLLVIELRNSGKELEPKDFHEPVRIVFPEGSGYVSVKTLASSDDFSPKIRVTI